MLPPRDLQRLFRMALTGSPPTALLAEIEGGVLGAERRLAIYQNHYVVSLVDVLAATYPAVQWLVGEPFFRAAARRFARTTPPRSPRLHEYGRDFAGFIGSLPECAGLPYLTDIARFEWAINRAYYAPEAAPLRSRELASLAPEACSGLAFTFHPSVQILASPYPLLRIWSAARPDSDEIADLAAGGVRLLVRRRDVDVVWRELDLAEFEFLSALVAGCTVGEAYRPGCEPLLAAAIAEGAIVDFHVRSPQPDR